MRTVCEGVYAALFNWNLALWSGDERVASQATAAGLGGLMAMNLLVVLGVLVVLFGPITAVPHSVVGLIGLSPLAVSYNAFIRRNRYVNVVRRFNGRSASEQRRIIVVAWTYVALSLVGPFVVLLVMSKR